MGTWVDVSIGVGIVTGMGGGVREGDRFRVEGGNSVGLRVGGEVRVKIRVGIEIGPLVRVQGRA